MPDTEKGKTWRKLSLISKRAERDPNFTFTSLGHLLNEEFLKDCYKSLNRDTVKLPRKKGPAVGVDEVSWEEYGKNLDKNLENLVERMKKKSYKPLPVKRVYIPKGNGEKRPLGIAAIENQIVEKGIKIILEKIYEEDFLDMSYGFRPKRNAHQALKELNDEIMFKPVSYIVEADIKGFFDNVTHNRLMELLKIRIKAPSLLFLIKRFLKAGYIENDKLIRTDSQGVAQGSILSPILANIFLHYVLDEWFEEVVKEHTKGYSKIIRYADDFICVVRYKKDAGKIRKGIENRLNKYGLKTNSRKTKVISFGRLERENAEKEDRKPNTFDFLGFTHYCDKSRKGNFKLGRKTARDKFRKAAKKINNWLRNIRNIIKTKKWWKILKSKLRGHYQYYGVSENYKALERYYYRVINLVYKWMNRRSEKSWMSTKDYSKYIRHYPLPKPKIVHRFY